MKPADGPSLDTQTLQTDTQSDPGDGGFIPSTQRYYRRLFYYLILLHVSVVRLSSSRNMLAV
jgi:hypothetical protein